MSFVRTVTATIDATPETVFALVADLTRHPEWADQRLTVHHVAGPEHGPGAEYTTRATHILPHTTKSANGRVVVRESTPSRRFQYECWDEGGHYLWTFDLEPIGSGTQLRHTVKRLTGPLLVRVLQPMMWKSFGGAQVRHGVANIKTRVETAQPSTEISHDEPSRRVAGDVECRSAGSTRASRPHSQLGQEQRPHRREAQTGEERSGFVRPGISTRRPPCR